MIVVGGKMNQIKIGKFIAQCRKNKKLTQQELADKIGVTDKAISKWENGRCLMDISLLKPLSECLDISIIELINGELIDENDVSKKSTEVIEKTLNYAKRNIKINKRKAIITSCISILLIVVFVFCLYKSVILFIYKYDESERYNNIINGLTQADKMTIYKKTLNEDEYLVLDNIKIRNDFSEFKLVTKNDKNDYIQYILKNESGKVRSAIYIGKYYSYVDLFGSKDVVMFADNNIGQFNSADRKYFLLRNDINNDIEFLEYVSKNGYQKSNILTSDRKIKENYALNMFVDVVFPENKDITIIDGDYTGYIFNSKDNIRKVNILKDDMVYYFTFIGDNYTSDEYLIDVLSTIEIKVD